MTFGVAVGFGMWSKYAILHLVLPLGVLFLATPRYRGQLLTARPWIAALTGLAILTPHAASVWMGGSDSLHYAMRTVSTTSVEKWGLFGNFLMNAAIINAIMAFIVGCAIGWRPLVQSATKSLHWRRMDGLDRYLFVAALGPLMVVLVSPLFDARPRALWITPFVIGFALWWAHVAARADGPLNARRLAASAGAFSALMLSGYLGVRLFGSLLTGHVSYPEMDSRALTALAQKVWAEHHAGPIPYIIGIPEQGGRHAIGSTAFDLPYRVSAIDDGEPATAPWVDIDDLKRKGALVVAIGRIWPGLKLLGEPVEPVGSYPRPLARAVSSKKIVSFGIIEGRSDR